MAIHINVPIFRTLASNIKDPEWAMRSVVAKAMQDAGIPFKWNMSESHPRPAAPGKLTLFHDRLMDQFEITWEPKDDLPPESG